LISKEYPKIAQALTSLQDQFKLILTTVQKARTKPDPVLRPGRYPPPPHPSLPLTPAATRIQLGRPQSMRPRKKRVYAARKLNYLA